MTILDKEWNTKQELLRTRESYLDFKNKTKNNRRTQHCMASTEIRY